MAQFNKFFEIRDSIIPDGKLVEFKEWLDNQAEIQNLEYLIGAIIYHNQINMLALISLYIHENKIELDKERVYESFYYAHCRKQYLKVKERGIIVDHVSWSELSIENQNKWKDLCNINFNY